MDRKTYVIDAAREGAWWILTAQIPELEEAKWGGKTVMSQARRLDQVEVTARDLIALVLEVPEGSFDIEVRPKLDASLAERVAQARGHRAAAEREQRASLEATEALVPDLLGDGYRIREVAWLLGITFQRVAQLAKPKPLREQAKEK